MKNVYYMIWVDGLLKMKTIPANKTDWKSKGFIFISMAMALNILSVVFIISLFSIKSFFTEFEISIFPIKKLNSATVFFLLYLVPVIIPNYFLIFWNNRYEELFKKYKSYNGKLCVTYLMISYFLPLIIAGGGTLIKMMLGLI